MWTKENRNRRCLTGTFLLLPILPTILYPGQSHPVVNSPVSQSAIVHELASDVSNLPPEAQSPDDEPWAIQAFGTMREAIGMGKHQGRIILQDLIVKPNFFAVGALEGLGGEITIHDGEVFVTRVDNAGNLQTLADGDAAAMQATLLLGAYVSEWVSISVPHNVPPDEADEFLRIQAKNHGIDTRRPFPWTVAGPLLSVHVHVINGACPVHARRNQQTIPAAQRPFDWHTETLSGTVVGIYAPDAAGRMTHPGSSVHAHLIFTNEGERATGHLERVGFASGAVLRLPKSVNAP
jgi:alpha-acetolactate decarboxylase